MSVQLVESLRINDQNKDVNNVILSLREKEQSAKDLQKDLEEKLFVRDLINKEKVSETLEQMTVSAKTLEQIALGENELLRQECASQTHLLSVHAHYQNLFRDQENMHKKFLDSECPVGSFRKGMNDDQKGLLQRILSKPSRCQ